MPPGASKSNSGQVDLLPGKGKRKKSDKKMKFRNKSRRSEGKRGALTKSKL